MKDEGVRAYCMKGHKDRCSTPSQCYCKCHEPYGMTELQLKRKIEEHRNTITRSENKIKELEDILEQRDQLSNRRDS